MAIEKLISEKRFKEVADTTAGADAATKYDAGDIVYDAAANDFKRTDGSSWASLDLSGAAIAVDTAAVTAAGALMDSECASLADVKALDQSVISGASPTFGTANMTDAGDKRFVSAAQRGYLVPMASGNSYAQGLVPAGNGTHADKFLRQDGTWQTAGGAAGPLSNSTDVKAYSAADVGDVLQYAFVEAEATIAWRSGTTIKVKINEAGRQGAAGNLARITAVTGGSPSATWNSGDNGGNGELDLVYTDGATTAASMKTLIEGAGQFTVTITGTSSHTGHDTGGQMQAQPFAFSGGAEEWKAMDKAADLAVSRDLDITGGNKDLHVELIDSALSGIFMIDKSSGSNKVLLNVGNIPARSGGVPSGIFQIIEKGGVAFDITTSNGNLKKRDGSTHSAGDINVGSDQYVELWYTGADWRYMIKSV